MPPDMSRCTVRDAADILGITTGAVRNRLSRGTLRSIKEGGTVYVLLPSEARDTVRRPRTYETPHDMSGELGAPRALISEMRGRIEDLRGQVEAEREANRENRRI